MSVPSNGKKTEKLDTEAIDSEYVLAVKFGRSELKVFNFEVYVGKVHEGNSGLCLFTERRVYNLNRSHPNPYMDYDIVPDFKPIGLVTLNEMILESARMNSLKGSSIYWWVDIGMDQVTPSRTNKYIAAFGLPNEHKFRSKFGTFGILSGIHEKDHIYVGNGTSNVGGVSSVTFMTQAFWVENIPIVDFVPNWISDLGQSILGSSLSSNMFDYLQSRFGFLLNPSGSSGKQGYHESAYVDAEGYATVCEIINFICGIYLFLFHLENFGSRKFRF